MFESRRSFWVSGDRYVCTHASRLSEDLAEAFLSSYVAVCELYLTDLYRVHEGSEANRERGLDGSSRVRFQPAPVVCLSLFLAIISLPQLTT